MHLRCRHPVAFANVGHTYTHLFMLLYPTVVLALEGEFGLSYGELLSLALPGTVLFGAGALPAGWLGDRWSAEGMLAAFFFGMGLAAGLTALATAPWHLAAGLGLIGLFASIYHPVGIALLVRGSANRGRRLGLNGVFGGLGTATAALVAGALVDLVHWRAAFAVPGALAMVTGLAYVASLRRQPPAPAGRPAARPVHAAGSRRRLVLALVGALGVTMLCSGLIYQSTTVAMPKVFDLGLRGVTPGGALGIGGLVTLAFAFSAPAQVLGGHLADRVSLKRLYGAAFGLQVPVLLGAMWLADLPLVVAAAAIAFLIVVGQPAENSLVAHYTPERWRATAYGAKFVVSLGVSALGVPLVALVIDLTGHFAALFGILGALAATAALTVWWVLPGDGRRERAEALAPATAARAG